MTIFDAHHPARSPAAQAQSAIAAVLGPLRELLSNAGWVLSGHVVAKVARVLSTLVVARLLLPEHFGVAALALFVYEISSVIARFSTTQAVVRSSQKDLVASCIAAHRISWLVGIALFLLQCIVATGIFMATGEALIPLVLGYLALAFLLLPFAAVNAGITLRNSRFRAVSLIEVCQAVSDLVLTVAFALSGFGVWSIILPKVMVIPIWILVHKRVSPLPAKYKVGKCDDVTRARLINFSCNVIACEIVKTVKNNIDLLLVGALFGIEMMGVYYFAVNAGLGLTRALTGAFNQALFPFLCNVRESAEQLQKRFVLALTVVVVVATIVALIQAKLAFWYVPLIFGTQWVEHGALPILTTLCFAAVPLAALESSGSLLRSKGRPGVDLGWNCRVLIALLIGVLAGAGWGLQGVANAVVVVNFLIVPVIIRFFLFKKECPSEKEFDSAVS